MTNFFFCFIFLNLIIHFSNSVSINPKEKSLVSEKKSFEDFVVLRLTPFTKAQNKLIKNLENENVNFWTDYAPFKTADVMFPPNSTDTIERIKTSGIKIEEFINNVQRNIEAEIIEPRKRVSELTWDKYYNMEAIHNWMRDQASNPLAEVISIGKSFENRDLLVMKISKKDGTNKPIIWVDGTVHAREWITTAVATYFIANLLNSTPTPEVNDWLQNFDFIVMPIFNPDGYVYSMSRNRMWRKSRSVSNNTDCFGTDPNRNFDFHWLDGGSSTDPCSDTYAGSSSFSEPETKFVSNYINKLSSSGNLKAYISLHSYSQMILFPFGHTTNKIPQYNEYMTIFGDVAKAMQKRHGTEFKVGNLADTLYVASGSSMDWVKGVKNVDVVFTYELRDKGRYGFILPSNQIKASGDEWLDGINVLTKYLKK